MKLVRQSRLHKCIIISSDEDNSEEEMNKENSRQKKQEKEEEASEEEEAAEELSEDEDKYDSSFIDDSDTEDIALDFYEFIEVTRYATQSEIKKAYRKQALRYHPDKSSLPNAESLMQRLNKIYEILSDVKLRSIYGKFMIEMSLLY